MKHFLSIIYLIILFIGIISCGERKQEMKEASPEEVNINTSYQFNRPTKVFTLPKELEEISGLTAIDNGTLACVQDEKGVLYLYDIESRKVSKEINWGEDGDYEGIAIAGNTIYVLRSDGDLFKIDNYSKDSPKVEKIETDIGQYEDAEGLCYLKERNSLLIACKGGEGEKRNIYEYNIDKGEIEQVFITIDFKELEERLVSAGIDNISLGLRKFLDSKGESKIFLPSAIAIHPITQSYYVLSSKSKLLLILNKDKKIENLIELTHELYRQPESITFTKNGDMFIGNEGRGDKGNILFFTYEK